MHAHREGNQGQVGSRVHWEALYSSPDGKRVCTIYDVLCAVYLIPYTTFHGVSVHLGEPGIRAWVAPGSGKKVSSKAVSFIGCSLFTHEGLLQSAFMHRVGIGWKMQRGSGVSRWRGFRE